MPKKDSGSGRNERNEGTGRFVPKGTARKNSNPTVTDPRKPKKK